MKPKGRYSSWASRVTRVKRRSPWRSLAAARRIGKVEVDHGDTGCKTPDAVDYIRKMAERRAAKAG